MNRGGVAAKIEGRAHCLARRRVEGRRGIMVKVDTHGRHERNPQPPQHIELSERATRPLRMRPIQKSLQSTRACVLEDPPGSSGFRGASIDSRPLRPIATRHLRRRAAPKVKRATNAKNTRKVRRIAPKIRLIV